MLLPPIWHHIPFLFPPSPIITDLRNWAVEAFKTLPQTIVNAWLYVQWIPSGIKETLYYQKDDKMWAINDIHHISLVELREMKNEPSPQHGIGPLTDEEYKAITSEEPIKLAVLQRNGNTVLFESDIIFDPYGRHRIFGQKKKDEAISTQS